MSWTGLKKAINRAGTQVMMKTGQIDETIDQQYDFEEKRFKTMESNSHKLHKELKVYLDLLRILTNAQVNVSEVLQSFYGDSESNNFSSEYCKVMKQLNDESLKDLEGPYNQIVLNLVARFNSYFTDINEAIKKRNNKKLDYDAMKKKLQKMIETPVFNGEYELKLYDTRNELISTKELYDDINDKLKRELPQLVNLRIPFLNPSFESFVKLQTRFFSDNHEKLNGLQSSLDANLRQDYINGKLESRLDNVLSRMRELNITNSK